jgi:DNA polymerase III subunit delta
VLTVSTPVQFICGADDYLVSAKARAVIDKLLTPDERALSLETIDGSAETVDAALEALGQCMQAVLTLGFLGCRKVVWFKDVAFLTDNRTGRSEAVKARLSELTEVIKAGLPDGTTLVVTAPAVDKRYAFFKACKSGGTITEFAVSDKAYVNEREAAQRLRDLATKAGLSMDDEARTAFLERVGTETRLMVNELEKLALYVGDRGAVTRSDIEAVTSAAREAIAWDLADAVGKRDLRRALMLLRQLLFQRQNPISLIAGLESRVRDLLVYREALEKGWLRITDDRRDPPRAVWGGVPPEVEAAFGEHFKRDPRSGHPYRIGLLAGQARSFSTRELRMFLRAVTRAHEKLVSSSVPPAILLELLLISMLGKRPKKAINTKA